MKSKLPIIVFIIVALIGSAAVAVAVVYRQLVGTAVYDTNFDTFHHTLSPEQGEGIIGTVHSIVGLYVMLLLVTNALWAAAACFLLSLVKRREDKSPNPNSPLPTGISTTNTNQ